MPGLEMPARGGGAAMLRELRDEERSPQSGERPITEPPGVKENAEYDSSYDKHTDNKTYQKEITQESKVERKQERNKSKAQASKQASREADQEEILSVAQMIRQRAARQMGQEVLKTVTLKLSPSLDERVERYCFENKMKKQEFWAEAAALYFETIGEAE